MRSLSKTPLTRSDLESIVARHFRGTHLLEAEELTEGFYNTAYRLDLGSGVRCVLKVAPPQGLAILRYERDILSAEVAVMKLVRARTSMPVPAILAFDPSGTPVGPPYYLMDFVAGIALHKLRSGLSLEDQRRIDYSIGQYLREMNAITGAGYGYCSPSSAKWPAWRSAFDAMVQGVLADGEDVGVLLPLPYPELHAALARHFDALDEVTTPRLVHWDLWDGNVFVDPETHQITGIIDFERALWGDPLMEFNFRAFDPTGAFAEGYGGIEDTPAARTRRLLYNVYLYLIMVIECTYRQYETQDQERWARQQLEHDLDELARL